MTCTIRSRFSIVFQHQCVFMCALCTITWPGAHGQRNRRGAEWIRRTWFVQTRSVYTRLGLTRDLCIGSPTAMEAVVWETGLLQGTPHSQIPSRGTLFVQSSAQTEVKYEYPEGPSTAWATGLRTWSRTNYTAGHSQAVSTHSAILVLVMICA